jgi:two-component system, sensor histidine kinase and response regulator
MTLLEHLPTPQPRSAFSASPAMQSALLDPVSSLASPAKPKSKPVLLVVDDEEGPRQSLKIVFKNDYEVLLANSGESAMEIARRHHIDVTVCDIMMTGMSGIEVLRRLKEIDPTVEVIMLTAFETIETARHAIRHGACDYLNKPFDIPAIRAAVSRALDKHRTTVGLRSTYERLQELQQELRDQKMQEEMARAKGEIYASVLHDINSPLTVISGFIELISASIADESVVEGEQLETIKDDLSKLTGQVGRCFEISQRYLSFLHAGAGGGATVGVRQVLSDLRELLARHPSARGQELVIHEAADELVAEINGTDLLQILLNLTVNALQCTAAPHRVEVRCECVSEPLDVSQFREASDERFINGTGFINRAPLLLISVEDNGPGIFPSHVAKLFEEKFSTKPVGEGTGIGLSIVKRLVVGAKGAIRVQTQPGGSKFTVCLRARA